MRFVVLIAAGLTSACTSTDAGEEVPAVLVSDVRSRAEIQQKIADILHSPTVVLADDALTRESELIVEFARPRDGDGRLLQGRELRPAHRFSLVKSLNRCVLIYRNSGQRVALERARCKEVQKPR